METNVNEIMTNEAVAEAAEDVVTVVSSNKNIAKTVAKIGITATLTVGGIYLIDKVVKHVKAKIATKKELDEVIDDVENACDVDYEDGTVDNVTHINEAK